MKQEQTIQEPTPETPIDVTFSIPPDKVRSFWNSIRSGLSTYGALYLASEQDSEEFQRESDPNEFFIFEKDSDRLVDLCRVGNTPASMQALKPENDRMRVQLKIQSGNQNLLSHLQNIQDYYEGRAESVAYPIKGEENARPR